MFFFIMGDLINQVAWEQPSPECQGCVNKIPIQKDLHRRGLSSKRRDNLKHASGLMHLKLWFDVAVV
jgi:hypothetical protein